MNKYKFLNIVGLMSGTSMDGINCTIIRTNGKSVKILGISKIFEYNVKTIKLLNEYNIDKKSFLLNSEKLVSLSNLITLDHAKAVKNIIINFPDIIDLIGFHGQTLLHDPNNKTSLQIGDGNLLAKLTKISVISNFRDNDILMGGQGAPIAPIYHKKLMIDNNLQTPSCFINIGGISNLTYFDYKNGLIGFDTGPGNCLMDDFVQKVFSLPYDNEGILAAKGSTNINILNSLLEDCYFDLSFPKSLDKHYFDGFINFIKQKGINKYDILSILSDLTIFSIIKGISLLPDKPKEIIVMGGGAKNINLIMKFKKHIKTEIKTAEEIGLNSEMIEAELIAFLAARSLYNLPITFTNTTGVIKPTLGGKLFSYNI